MSIQGERANDDDMSKEFAEDEVADQVSTPDDRMEEMPEEWSPEAREFIRQVMGPVLSVEN